MIEDCCACSSQATTWIRDGVHLKPVCGFHDRKFRKEAALLNAGDLLRLALDFEVAGEHETAAEWLESAAFVEAEAFAI